MHIKCVDLIQKLGDDWTGNPTGDVGPFLRQLSELDALFWHQSDADRNVAEEKESEFL